MNNMEDHHVPKIMIGIALVVVLFAVALTVSSNGITGDVIAETPSISGIVIDWSALGKALFTTLLLGLFVYFYRNE